MTLVVMLIFVDAVAGVVEVGVIDDFEGTLEGCSSRTHSGSRQPHTRCRVVQ